MLHYSYKYHTIRLFFLQSVKARSEKIAEDEQRCKQLADVAQKDLDAAIPALEEAVKVRTYIHVCIYVLVCMCTCTCMCMCFFFFVLIQCSKFVWIICA